MLRQIFFFFYVILVPFRDHVCKGARLHSSSSREPLSDSRVCQVTEDC